LAKVALLARPRANLYLDLIAFLALFATLVSGLVLRLALPPGSGRPEVGSLDRPVDTLWGWARHEWGNLHYWVSLALLAVLASHVWLHRDWVAGMMKRESSRDSGKFFSLGMVACVALVMVGLSPLWADPIQQTRAQVLEQRGQPAVPGSICFTEGAALSAADLEQVTGVPKERFAPAAGQTITPAQARQRVLDYYAAEPQPEPLGAKIFAAQCSGCHADPAALPDLGKDNSKAIERLRQAKPVQAHRQLAALNQAELVGLLDYLRAARQH
jgi:mono/diheme cytochrome c family protein